MTHSTLLEKRMLVVYNPTAGASKQQFLQQVLAELKLLGVEPELYATKSAGDATTHVLSCAKDYDVIVAAGGDGTINEVLNGLVGSNAVLGIIPMGTANILAIELHIPLKPKQIAEILATGETKIIYPAWVNDRRFAVMVGVGFDAWVVENVDLDLKRKYGKLAYVVSIFKQLLKFGHATYEIEANNQTFHAQSIIATLARNYAGRYTISKTADISQPDIQLVMIQTHFRLLFLLLLFILPLGLAEKLPFIKSVTTKKAKIKRLNPVHILRKDDLQETVQADGDTLATLPIEISVEQQATGVLVKKQAS